MALILCFIHSTPTHTHTHTQRIWCFARSSLIISTLKTFGESYLLSKNLMRKSLPSLYLFPLPYAKAECELWDIKRLKRGKIWIFHYGYDDGRNLLAYIYHGKWKWDFLHHYLHSTHTSESIKRVLLNDSGNSPLFAFCQQDEAWALRAISSSHVKCMTTSDEENVLET